MEKNKNLNKTVTAIIIGLVIVGLCAYIFVDFRMDNIAAESARLACVAGMNGCARSLSDDLVAGDMTLAYHHAAEAADYAYRAGQNEPAVMFSRISASILDGTVDGTAVAEIDGFLVSGLVGEDIAKSDYSAAEEFSPVSSVMYENAREVAGKFFGSGMLLRGEQISNKAILFSVSNAYAVIDGEKCVPIEAAISLEEGEPVLAESDCVNAAKRFLSDFFPADISEKATVTGVSSDMGGKRTNVTFSSSGVIMTVTVRRDSGRVVRFVSGR